MLRSNLSRAIRHLRRRRGWRQSDLAARAGVSRESISRLERGRVGALPVARIERIVAAIDADLELRVRWQGADLDRLIDSAHASLVEAVVEALTSCGWLVRTEISFNHYGDRGRVDVLACWAATGLVLVAEVKSALGDLQATAGALDVKVRNAKTIAASVGWTCTSALPALIIGDSRTARRVVAGHPAAFARFSARGRAALAWVRHPVGPAPSGLLWFAELPDSHPVTVTRNRRVRTVERGG